MDKQIRKQIKEELFKRDPSLATNLELQETNDKLDAVLEELKKKDLLEFELDRSEVKGDKGDSYILTDDDKHDIAAKIKVPIVEKIVEIVHEQPIVEQYTTNEIKEVAVTDKPDIIAEKLNTLKGAIDFTVIKGMPEIPNEKKIRDDFEKYSNQPAKGKLDQRWHGGGLSKVSHDTTLTGDGTASNPLHAISSGGTWGSITGDQSDVNVGGFTNDVGYLTSLSGALLLDQTTPQTFTAGTVTGSGLLKVTAGELGLDTKSYLDYTDTLSVVTNNAVLLSSTSPQNVTQAPNFDNGISLGTIGTRGSTPGQIQFFTGNSIWATAFYAQSQGYDMNLTLPTDTGSGEGGVLTLGAITGTTDAKFSTLSWAKPWTSEGYLTSTTADALYYPLSTNPAGYLTAETDPLSLHLIQGSPQTVTGSAPIFEGGIELGKIGGNTAGQLAFLDGSASSYLSVFSARAQAGNIYYTLPATSVAGSLTNDGSGNLSWVSASGMVYPGAGIAKSTGSAWDTSISGTSSQFVKGDGSLDSSTYVTGTPWTGLGYITRSGISAGTGISYNNSTGVITNSAPDQTVAITAGTNITSVTGTYPNFTINAATQSQDLTPYAKLDGTNQPFTGNVNISKVAPLLTLTSTDDSSNTATIGRVATGRELFGTNYVATPGYAAYGLNFVRASTQSANFTTHFPTGTGTSWTGQYSFYFWTKSPNGTNNNYRYFVQSPNGYIISYCNASGQFTFVSAQPGYGPGYTVTGANVNDGNWHMVVVTVNTSNAGATKVHVYVDANASVAGDYQSNDSGNSSYGALAQNGGANFTMDEFHFWNRELSSAEVTTLWNGGTGVFGDVTVSPFNSGLVGGYHFENANGGTPNDYVGSNNLSLVNSPTYVAGYINPPASVSQGKWFSYINGSAAAEKGKLYLGDPASGTYLQGQTLHFNTNATERASITNGGLFTLGSATPGTGLLNVVGNADVVQTKIIANATQTSDIFDIFASDGTTKRLSVTGSGYLGIGNITPSSAIHVVDTSTPQLQFGNAGTYGSSGGAGFVGYADTGSAITSGSRIGFALFGSVRDNTHAIQNSAGFQAMATENWSSGHQGTRLDFLGTPTASSTRAIWMSLLDGNMGIGVTSPNANAILDVSSTTKAFMPPRMTTTQKAAIASPTAGMVVYDSTLNKLSVYTGATWETVTSL